MSTPLVPARARRRAALASLTLFLGGVSLFGAVPAATFAVEPTAPVDPANLQHKRRPGVTLVRQIERPALIERLSREIDPVELQPRDMAILEAYLTANSRPRRQFRDGFYSDRIALRGSSFDDPENRQLIASPTVRDDEWQRLRTHLLFNRMLVAQKAEPHVAR